MNKNINNGIRSQKRIHYTDVSWTDVHSLQWRNLSLMTSQITVSTLNSSFKPAIKKEPKLQGIHQSPVDLPSQRTNNTGSVSMEWRHHGGKISWHFNLMFKATSCYRWLPPVILIPRGLRQYGCLWQATFSNWMRYLCSYFDSIFLKVVCIGLGNGLVLRHCQWSQPTPMMSIFVETYDLALWLEWSGRSRYNAADALTPSNTSYSWYWLYKSNKCCLSWNM